MDGMHCPDFGLGQPKAHSFCIKCGAILPSHLLDEQVKRSRIFPAIPVAPDDPRNAFLKVSCYLREQRFSSAEGEVTIPGKHVRFSLWVGDSARCVASLPETEARDLATFIATQCGDHESHSKPSVNP